MTQQKALFLFFSAFSSAALLIAVGSEYFYGLQPCELCYYQRLPYILAAVFGLSGFIASGTGHKKGEGALMIVLSVAFFANAAIAFYHSGVERKWWPSYLEGCSIPVIQGDVSNILAQISAKPAVRCDAIPWADPILGLSMANYNVLACIALSVLAVSGWRKISRQTS